MTATMNWRAATESEIELMSATTGGILPPGAFAVLCGTLPAAEIESLCGLAASLDNAAAPRAYSRPPADMPEWAELGQIADRILPAVKDTTWLVVGVGKAWSVELRFEPDGRVELGRRRQGMLESSRGFFAPEDY